MSDEEILDAEGLSMTDATGTETGAADEVSSAGGDVGSEDTSVSAVGAAGGDAGGDVVNAEQFLEVFELKKTKIGKGEFEYSMTVNGFLQKQLEEGIITREDFDKRVEDAQKYLRNGGILKPYEEGKFEPWKGSSDGAEMPTLTPSKGDADMMEQLYMRQNERSINEIWRAFDVDMTEKDTLFLKSKEDAADEDILKAEIALLRMGWTSAIVPRTENRADGSDYNVDVFMPAKPNEKNLIDELVKYRVWKDNKSKDQKLADKIKKHFLGAVGTLTGGMVGGVGDGTLIGGGAGKDGDGTLAGGETGATGEVKGSGEENKDVDATFYVDSSHDTSGRIRKITPFETKLFSELGVADGDTAGDFLCGQFVKIFEKLNADVKLIHLWVVEWVKAKALENSEEARNAILPSKDGKEPGLLDNLTKQIQNRNVDGALATLKEMEGYIKDASPKYISMDAAKKSIREYSDTINANMANLKNPNMPDAGIAVVKQLASARDALICALNLSFRDTKGAKQVSKPAPTQTLGRGGAYTP